MVTLGGTINSLWNKWHLWLRFLRLLIPTAKPFLFSISLLLMHLYLMMPLKHLKWTNLMVGRSTDNTTPLFLIQTQIPDFNLNRNQWPLPLESKRACRLFLRNVALKFHGSRPNTNQSAHLKARVVAWPGSSLSRMTLCTKSPCWRHVSRLLAMSAFCCPSFTASWTQSRWWVYFSQNLIQSNKDFLSVLGWCKYCYQEHTKGTFAEAKEHAREVLDACPKEVIQCFINRLWWFIDSYNKGLTGDVTSWVVHKQKGHWSVSEGMMKALRHDHRVNR